MIERTQAYRVGDQTFGTLEEAQAHEISIICGIGLVDDGRAVQTLDVVVQNILAEKDRVIDILSTTPNSKVKARRINGGTKKRKAPAQPDLPKAV